MDNVQIPAKAFQDIISYLANRPFFEVSGIINQLEPTIRSMSKPPQKPIEDKTSNSKQSKK